MVAEIVGLPPEKVMVRNHLIGGGFGRRLAVDTIEQAARFARQVNYPLKIIWTREQDIQHDRFRPAYHDKIAAALDAHGMPVALSHRTIGSTVRSDYDRKPWAPREARLRSGRGCRRASLRHSARRSDWVRQTAGSTQLVARRRRDA